MRHIKRFLSGMAIGLLLSAAAEAAAPVDIVSQPPAKMQALPYVSPEKGALRFAPAAQLTIIHLWATWCVPCVQELPELDALYAGYQAKGLAVLPLAMGAKDAAQIQAFYAAHGIARLPVALDPALQAQSVTQAKGLPTSLFVDAKGEIVARADGQVAWSTEKTKAFLDAHLTP